MQSRRVRQPTWQSDPTKIALQGHNFHQNLPALIGFLRVYHHTCKATGEALQESVLLKAKEGSREWNGDQEQQHLSYWARWWSSCRSRV